jgi:hypothetical protein
MHRISATIAIGFFMFILWIIYLANTGEKSIFFDFVRSFPYGDKVGHAGLFGFLTLVAVIGSKFRCFNFGKFKIYHGATWVVLFVVGEEISQAFIPSRTFDLVDLVADVVGIAVATCMAYKGRRYFSKSAIMDEERVAIQPDR